MTVVDLLYSETKCRVHAEPVWKALPDVIRGQSVDRRTTPAHQPHPSRLGDRAALVASRNDAFAARRRGYSKIALIEHGIGQSYVDYPSGAYPGGAGRDMVGLFLSPNEHAAKRDREAYPSARVAVIGCPRLDSLPKREKGPGPVVVISFHWSANRPLERRSALAHYRDAIPALAERFTVLGHAHPMAMRDVLPVYKKAGIEVVESFDEVCRRADVYVADNTSTLYEFASTGRPVVVLNAPWYRRDVEHGLRFWGAAGVGVPVWEPAVLAKTIGWTIANPDIGREQREAALDIAYAYRKGAAKRGAKAITEWLA